MIPLDPTILMEMGMYYADAYPTLTKVIVGIIVFPVTPTLVGLYAMWKFMVRKFA